MRSAVSTFLLGFPKYAKTEILVTSKAKYPGMGYDCDKQTTKSLHIFNALRLN